MDRRFDLFDRLLLLFDLLLDLSFDLRLLSFLPTFFVPSAWPCFVFFFGDGARDEAPRFIFGLERSSWEERWLSWFERDVVFFEMALSIRF